MKKVYVKNSNQKDAYTSPWSKKESILIRVWELTWILFISWLPKFCYPWYCFVLKLFGCKIYGKPFISPSCRIYAPWLLEINDKACLGFKSEVYNLGPVTIGKRAVIAQYSYLCNGSHDFNSEILYLMIGNMKIEEDVFIGAKAIILPGLVIRKGSIVGAGSVLTKDTKEFGIYCGNPAKYIKYRYMNENL